MSSFRTTLSSMRQRSEGSPWTSLLAGLIIGLLLGLFIGWVVWPVQWQNAYLSDLSPDARAEYLSAVADSYVVYSSDAARIQAQERLTSLQGNALTELQSAMEYYRARPSQENEIRIYNLAQLANALGGQANPAIAQVVAPAANVVIATLPAGNEVPFVVATAESSGAGSSVNSANSVGVSLAEESEGSGWLSWLLTLFAGILLAGGGFYLLQRLRQSGEPLFSTGSGQRVVGGRASVEDDYSFADEPEFGEGELATTSRSTYTPWLDEQDSPPSSRSVSGRRSSWQERTDDPDFGDGLADEEVFDDNTLDDDTLDDDTLDDDTVDNNTSAPPTDWQSLNRTNSTGTSAADPYRRNQRTAHDSYNNELPDSDDSRDVPDSRFLPSTAKATPWRQDETVRASVPESRASDEFDPDDTDDTDDFDEEDDVLPSARAEMPSARHRNLEDSVPQRPEQRTQPTRTGSAPIARYGSSKTIGSFDCAFFTGMSDYDESFNVADPVTKRYIGECGMGVSTKNRILHKNPDEVIALEVWLFDKGDGSSLSTSMRVLMSEFASDHYADVFTKERNGDARPFVAQRGVKFQLEGPTLILNGEVIEADYSREGIFQSVKVHMDVLKR